jgi:hypothetical protein
MIPPTLLSTPRPAQDSLSDLDQPGDAGGHDEECFTSALGNMPDLQVKVATAPAPAWICARSGTLRQRLVPLREYPPQLTALGS